MQPALQFAGLVIEICQGQELPERRYTHTRPGIQRFSFRMIEVKTEGTLNWSSNQFFFQPRSRVYRCQLHATILRLPRFSGTVLNVYTLTSGYSYNQKCSVTSILKVNLSIYKPWRRTGGVEVHLHLILNPGTRRRWLVKFSPRLL